jgi:anti-sigma factor RsiW
MFQEHLRTFIDDELPVTTRTLFIEHSMLCPRCAANLREQQFICERLASLQRVTVSPEFDFAMKLRIRREHESLQKPWYVLKRTIVDNAIRFISIPAAAMFIVASVFLYLHTTPGTPVSSLPPDVARELSTGAGVELVTTPDDNHVEEVNYVLEKATTVDIERGIIMSGDTGIHTESQNITLISF